MKKGAWTFLLLAPFIYAILGKIFLNLAISPGYATPIFPPAGFALFLVLFFGYRSTLFVVLGSLLLNCWVASSTGNLDLKHFLLALSVGLGAGLQAALGRWFLSQHTDLPLKLIHADEIGKFFLFGGILASFVNACWGVGTLYLGGLVAGHDVFYSLWTWWVGDAIGVIVTVPVFMCFAGEAREIWRPRRLTVAVPTLLTVLATVLFFFKAAEWNEKSLRKEFEKRTNNFSDRIHQGFSAYEMTLSNLSAQISTLPRKMTDKDFKGLVKNSLENLPGIYSLGWIAVVDHAQRREFEKKYLANTDHKKIWSGDLKESKVQERYFPVVYVEPAHRAQAILGYDLAADPRRAGALKRGLETASMAASEVLELIQEPTRKAIALYAPSIRNGKVFGYISGVFEPAVIFRSVLEGPDEKKKSDGIAVEIGFSETDSPFYTNESPDHPSAWTVTEQSLAGRKFYIRYAPTTEFNAAERNWSAFGGLLAALIFCCFLTTILLLITGNYFAAEEIVRYKTQKLNQLNSDLKNEVEERRAIEARLKTIFQLVPTGIFETDLCGNFIFVNDGWCKLTGYSEQDVMGNGWQKAILEDDRPSVVREFGESVTNNTDYVSQFRFQNPSGRIVWVSVRTCLEKNSQGEPVGFVGAIYDITALKEKMEEIRQANQALEHAVEGMARLDENLRFTFVNPAFSRLFGYTSQEFLGKSWELVYPPSEILKIQNAHQAMLLDGKSSLETRGKRKDGSLFDQEVTLVAAFDRQNEIRGLHCFTRDISRRKAAEEQLSFALASQRHAYQILSDAVEMLDVGFVLYDRDERLVIYNSKYAEIYSAVKPYLAPGLRYEDILRNYCQMGGAIPNEMSPEDFIRERLRQHRNPGPPLEQIIAGRMIQVIDRKTKDGGVVSLRWDLTELRSIENELRSAKDEAEKANRIKSEFLANMSHEIRTPLNGIMGFLSLLSETSLSATQEEYVQTALQSSEVLLTVINDILDFSKVEAGKMQLEEVDFELEKIIQETLKFFQPSFQAKNLKIRFEGKKECGVLLGDPARLQQILFNLISNAIKFTKQGEIVVRVESVDRAHSCDLKVSVIDSGIGIPQYALQRIFSAFSQVDSSTTRRFGGTGLGLSICKKLVDLMHGEIGVESVEQQGSTFWFKVNLKKSDLKKAIFAERANSHVEKHHERILVVEDIQINRLLMVEMLSKLGYKADAVANGNEALDSLRSIPYDLILMDCQMPELDGFETTKIIRNGNIQNTKVPIVALTASALKGDREKCLAAGMDDYLSKPISLKNVESCLKKWLSHSTPREQIILDQMQVEALRSLKNGKVLLQVVDLFITKTAGEMTKLSQAAGCKDLESLRKLAHGLKSSAAQLGLVRLAPLFEKLEAQAHSGNFKEIEMTLVQAEAEYAMALPALRKLIA